MTLELTQELELEICLDLVNQNTAKIALEPRSLGLSRDTPDGL